MKQQMKYLFMLFVLLCFQNGMAQELRPKKEVSHTFFAIGDIGEVKDGRLLKNNLDALQKRLQGASDKTTLLFLGNNFPKEGSIDGLSSESIIKRTISSFQGRTIVIPGNSDWKDGLSGLKMREKTIQTVLGEKSFLPENGCPIERIKIDNSTELLIIDSQWALMDWNKYPSLNAKCAIKTKERFYEEIESLIKKAEGKMVYLVTHHPVESNGKYGDKLSFGVNPQDLSNSYYKEFSDRIMTIVRQTNNVVLLSGHDNNLQFFYEKGVPVVISGSGASTTRVSRPKDGFGKADVGFSILEQYADNSIRVSFYGASNGYNKSLYSREIVSTKDSMDKVPFAEYKSPEYVSKSIYEPETANKSRFYQTLWGEHYRQDYVTEIKVKTALLDTLYGGLTPVRKGGGHQTDVIRLTDKNGKEYTMRSVKKSALRFIQYFLFKTEYLEPEVANTLFVELLKDYWTTANPYAALTVTDLADALGVLHPNPKLFFIPKQATLGQYNANFGNEMYYIEEHLSDTHLNETSLGNAKDIISTEDLFEEIRSKGMVSVDKKLYIRTRLFDNLIGDWDRHADQWKWAKTEKISGKEMYLPIPRDRDQVYSDFDGAFLKFLTLLNPPLRFMQRYDDKYKNVRWYNDAGDDVDLAVLRNHTKEDWLREARFIKMNLTEDIIEKAFANLPSEIDQSKVGHIKKALKGRLEGIEENAVVLYEYLAKRPIVVGTDKKDEFDILRMSDGKTKITGFRKEKKHGKEVFFEMVYDARYTSEVWIFGLGGEDTFKLEGEHSKNIKIKIIGGNDRDSYFIKNKRNVKVYDQKSALNTFHGSFPKRLSDNYKMNTYQYRNNRRDIKNYIPLLGFEPDDGFAAGMQFNYEKNSLVRNPFTDQHELGASYFFSTKSVRAWYTGEYAFLFDQVNLGLELGFSSPNYTDNFFGLGNDTQNLEDDLGMDFNRVRMQRFQAAPSLIFRGYQGSAITLGVSYENIQIERTQARFIDVGAINDAVFSNQEFAGVETSYEYDNLRDETNSKSGFGGKITVGFKSNIGNDNSFAYVTGQIRMASKLDSNGRYVLATKAWAQANLSNEFEFYQGAVIGGNNGLRGFREQRYTGKSALYQSTDLRCSLGRLRNGVLPIGMVTYVGFDYGRVWIENDNSNTWHTAYGGGFNFSLSGFTNLNLAYFQSNEGGRAILGLGFPF